MSAEDYPRILLFSRSAPDGPSGTPAILERLLAPIPAGRVEILCEDDGAPERRRVIDLPHPIRRVAPPFRKLPTKLGSALRVAAQFPSVVELVGEGLRAVRRFSPDVIVTVLFDDRWVLASHLLARVTGIPHAVVVHDAYRENAGQRRFPWQRAIPGRLEPLVLRHARVTTILGGLAQRYRDEHGIDVRLIRSPAPAPPRPARTPRGDGRLRIGFAGAVYDNVVRPLAQMARVVARDPALSLDVLSPATSEFLAAHGIAGERIKTRFERGYDRLLAALGEYDLLYLPLSATGGADLGAEALQYAFPTKAIDYLLSGAPILVHCPEHFEVHAFFREHGAAHLLTADDDLALGDLLARFRRGEVAPIPDGNRLAACAAFAPEVVHRQMREFLIETARHRPALPAHEAKIDRCPACQASWTPGEALEVDARAVSEPMFTEELRERLGGLRVRRCGVCESLIAVDGRRATGALAAAYDHLPEAYWTDLAPQSRLAAALDRALPPGDGLDLWDVGCGDGRLLAALPDRFRKHGVEPGTNAVMTARARGIDAHAGTASQLGLRAVADVITCVDVVEHLTQPLDELRAMAAMLRPGGTLAVVTGDAGALTARLAGADWYYLQCLGHVTVLSRQALERLAADAGFEAIRVRRIDHEAAVGARAWGRSYLRNRLRRIIGGRADSIYYCRDHQLLLARRPAGTPGTE